MIISIPVGLGSNHVKLFRQEVDAVARHIMAWARFEKAKPLGMLIFTLDLRSRMGFECVTSFHPIEAVRNTIDAEGGEGRCPGLTFPLHRDGGLVLLETYFPDLAEPVRLSHDGIPLILVDEHNVAVAIIIGRMRAAGSA